MERSPTCARTPARLTGNDCTENRHAGRGRLRQTASVGLPRDAEASYWRAREIGGSAHLGLHKKKADDRARVQHTAAELS